MEKKTIRVFVGNLPPDTNEEGLKNKINKYASVVSVEIKHRSDGLFAFVNLQDSQTNLEKCFQKLSRKKWKDYQLKVELAKESFLQRLARERLENEKLSKKNVSAPVDVQHTAQVSVFQESAVHSIGKIATRKHKKTNDSDSDSDNSNDSSTADSSTAESSNDSSSEDVPKKGNLQMFTGTKTLFGNEIGGPTLERNSKTSLSRFSIKKLNEEKEVLEKFEMFNSVWKDTSSDDTEEKTDNAGSKKLRKKKALVNLKFEKKEPEDMNILVSHSNETQLQGEKFNLKIEEGEKRRMKAMEERQKELLKRKQVVKLALASVDNTSRPNKRILFTDDDVSIAQGKKYSCRNGDQKLSLFSDDEMEYETNNDFRIRNQFEGKKGQSLLALQARYGSDKRFTLDERFVESDGESQEEEKVESANGECDTKAERERLLRILGTVLGKEVQDIDKTKPKHTIKPMLRYDPTKPDHVKFEIKQNTTGVKSKKKIEENAINHTATVEEDLEKAIDDLPVVSKEKYYRVSDTLQQTLQNNEQKFSLLEMFGNEDENEKDTIANFNVKPIINKKEWSLNHFNRDSSASEDETEETKHTISDDYDRKNYGVKQESLFFEKNDPRFNEGLDFINQVNEEYMENFNKIRRDLKSIVKKKVRNDRKKAEKWKTKLGGKKNIISNKQQKANSRRKATEKNSSQI